MAEKRDKTGKKKAAAPKKRVPGATAKRKPAPHTRPPASAQATAGRLFQKERGGEKPERAVEAAPSSAASAAPVRAAAAGIHDLRPALGATHYRKRVGRGPGSGHGKTAGRGNKGQKSRTGYRHQRGFEGGQMPFHRRVPKRGFTNIFRVEYDIVSLSDLDRFEAGQSVGPDTLRGARLAGKSRPIKILGNGEIGKALTVSAHKFSASAKARIEAAGGRCEVVPR